VQVGINFCNLVEFQYKAFNEYKNETGSKMLNICQCSIGQPNDKLAPVKKAVSDGAYFVCLGRYDFQVVNDVNIKIDILGSLGKCERPWYS